MVQALLALGLHRADILASYLTLTGFTRHLNLKSLIANTGRGFTLREFPRSTEIFVNNQKTFLHVRYDAVGQLVSVAVVRDTDAMQEVSRPADNAG